MLSSIVESQRTNLRSLMLRLLDQCTNMRELKQIHNHIIKSPHIHQNDQPLIISRLLFFCAISDSGGSLSYADNVFLGIKNPNLFVYNIMIRAHATKTLETRPNKCFLLYKQMLSQGVSPNCLTFPFLVKECATGADFFAGSSLHTQAIRFGSCDDVFVQNSLISLYSACGCLSLAQVLFDEIPEKDIVSWNLMIVGYLRNGDLDEALGLFRTARDPNIVSWNSIITGFVHSGQPKQALELFHEMLIYQVTKPDKITISSVTTACAQIGAIDLGKRVHTYLIKSGLECDVAIGTALVDMYGKCGSIERAREVFEEMPERDTSAYTAMISVLALHGHTEEAFELFRDMGAKRVKPNHVTFIGLLSACSHSGSVERGRRCFGAMKRVHSIEPRVYHYACLVDLLARSGMFEEAERVITEMPMNPDVFVWGALLGGCRMHGNLELGERVAKYLIDLEPMNHAFYIDLRDIYVKSGGFEKAKRVRKLMEERGVKKEVIGCSLIEINGVVHEFSVRGSPYLEMERVLQVSYVLNKEMCDY